MAREIAAVRRTREGGPMIRDTTSNVIRVNFARDKDGKGAEPTGLRYATGPLRSGHVYLVAVDPATKREVRFIVSPDEARKVGYDLLNSASKADDWIRHLRGYNRYIVEPGDAPGVIFVRHADKIHRWRETTIRKRSRCVVCLKQAEPGAVMFQQVEFGSGDAVSSARWSRLCQRCAKPAPEPDIKPAEAKT